MQFTYVLKTRDGQYYTGRAGDGWLSADVKEAFRYTKEGAENKAGGFNRTFGRFGGVWFEPVQL